LIEPCLTGKGTAGSYSNHQVQLVSATVPAFAYVSSPGKLSEIYETRYAADMHNTYVWVDPHL